jgi:hypothetical protein
MNVEFLKDVALPVAQEQRLETVMKTIVEGISEEPDVALVPRTRGYLRRLLSTAGVPRPNSLPAFSR